MDSLETILGILIISQAGDRWRHREATDSHSPSHLSTVLLIYLVDVSMHFQLRTFSTYISQYVFNLLVNGKCPK